MTPPAETHEGTPLLRAHCHETADDHPGDTAATSPGDHPDDTAATSPDATEPTLDILRCAIQQRNPSRQMLERATSAFLTALIDV